MAARAEQECATNESKKRGQRFPIDRQELQRAFLFSFFSVFSLLDRAKQRHQRADCRSFCVAVVIYGGVGGRGGELVLSVTRISGSACTSAGSNAIIARKMIGRSLFYFLSICPLFGMEGMLERDEYVRCLRDFRLVTGSIYRGTFDVHKDVLVARDK